MAAWSWNKLMTESLPLRPDLVRLSVASHRRSLVLDLRRPRRTCGLFGVGSPLVLSCFEHLTNHSATPPDAGAVHEVVVTANLAPMQQCGTFLRTESLARPLLTRY